MNFTTTSQHAVIDQTLLSTPEPKACSTNKKERLKQSNLHLPLDAASFSQSRDSLGLLTLNDVDLTPTLERPRAPNYESLNVSVQLQRQRHLAEGVLSGNAGLTSMYLKSMVKSEKKMKKASESTIDDSDFLSNVSAKSFYPSDVSTPRSSSASVDLEGSISSGLYIAGNISLMADKMKNSDISIADLCKQYESSRKGDQSIINDTFLSSSERAADMILQDELAWRQEFDTIPQPIHDSEFSNLRESTIMDEKPSMGEFFRVKSDECSTIFKKESPEKDVPPAALVSNSTMIDDSRNSINSFNISSANNIEPIEPPLMYNVSEIMHLLSQESMSKSYLLDCLVNQNCEIPQTLPITTKALLNEQIDSSKSKGETITFQTPQLTRSSNVSPKLDPSKQAAHKVDILSKQQPTSIRSSLSPKSNVSKKVNYTDTFTSDKLLSTNISSSKSSFEDLSDKENTASARNVSPCGDPRCRSPNRSLVSLRSSSSLDHLIDGRVPVESTKVELVWATVRVGKPAYKEFVLRNKMHQKIRFQIMVTGSCFKLIKPEGESQVPISILLHPLESRSFTVSFAPTAIGAYSERLIIQSSNKTSTQNRSSQKILLYGYGGHINPDVRSALKDSTGKYCLLLGTIEEISDTVTKHLSITNTGTLSAFVDITLNSKQFQLFTGLKILPNAAVIPAGGIHHFVVRYTPNKDDFRRLKYEGMFTANVCEVVTIKCVFGAEVLRGRIRRLASKLEGHVKTDDMLISRIIKPIPEENMPADIRLLSESIASLNYLVQHLNTKEIAVTVEQDMDSTLVATHNDSTTFQTLYGDINDITCIDQDSVLFNVFPKVLVLSPNVKHSDVIFLVNNGHAGINFETRISKALVDVVPQSGFISALNTTMLKISCKRNIDVSKNQDLKLTVCSDNLRLEVNIQIMCINIPS